MAKKSNKNILQINLNDGNKVSINVEESEIKIFLADSKNTIFLFDSSDVEGLNFLYNDSIKYLSEQLALDSSIDEVLDTCESTKDNIKQLYRENPHLINYSKVYLYKDLPRDHGGEVESNVNLQKKGPYKLINLIHPSGLIFAAVVLIIAILIGFRHNILCTLQGGDIKAYEPVYQLIKTGQTFKGDSLEYTCVKETSAGYKTLFDIK